MSSRTLAEQAVIANVAITETTSRSTVPVQYPLVSMISSKLAIEIVRPVRDWSARPVGNAEVVVRLRIYHPLPAATSQTLLLLQCLPVAGPNEVGSVQVTPNARAGHANCSSAARLR